MSVELFYTKELKALLKDLRSKDALNLIALGNVNKAIERTIYSHIGLLLFISFVAGLFLFKQEEMSPVMQNVLYVAMGCAICIIIYGMFSDIRTYCNRYAVLLSSGIKSKGKIIKKFKNIRTGGPAPNWGFKYEYTDFENNKHINVLNVLLDYHDNSFSENDTISVFYSLSVPSQSVLALPILFDLFNLNKERKI